MRTRRFFISDLHIGHANILKYEPFSRPFKTIQEHDEFLVRNWNHFIQPQDLVYYGGDVGGFNSSKQYIKDVYKRLNGTKILIRGNHDKFTDKSYYEMGFVAILQEAEIQLGKELFIKICHCPYANIEEHRDYPIKGRRPEKYNGWLLAGHTHSNSPQVDAINKVINISWDVWKRPVVEDQIRNIIMKNGDLK